MPTTQPKTEAPPDLLRPLPLREGPIAAEIRTVAYDRSDARWHEPLVDLAQAGLLAEAFYARSDGGNAPYHGPIAGAVPVVAARRGVAERLLRADAALAPHGVRLKVLDGFRSIATQQGLWDFVWQEVAAAGPTLSRAEIEAKVLTFVSDPRRFDPADETSWPLHSPGGAVDVVLVDAATARELDHGAGFDEATERSFTDHLERELLAGRLGAEAPALRSRRLLVNAMVNAGFTNYAYEFWHFDYGTPMHVLSARGDGAPTRAWYGTTTLEQHGLSPLS